jgi:phage baseplate assembly protein W
MAQYIGYNTIGQTKKFTLTGRELVKRDLLNALSIREGELPGKPSYGTSIWNYVFEPNVPEIERRIVAEMQRLLDSDPRIEAEQIEVFSQDHGILIEMNVRILPDVDLVPLNILFETDTNLVRITS